MTTPFSSLLTSPDVLESLRRAVPSSDPVSPASPLTELQNLISEIRQPVVETEEEKEEKKRRGVLSKKIQDELLRTPRERSVELWQKYLSEKYGYPTTGEKPKWHQKLRAILGEGTSAYTASRAGQPYNPRQAMMQAAEEEYKTLAGPLQRESAVLEASERASKAQAQAREKHKDLLELKADSAVADIALKMGKHDLAQDALQHKKSIDEIMGDLRKAQTEQAQARTEEIKQFDIAGPDNQMAVQTALAEAEERGEQLDRTKPPAHVIKRASELVQQWKKERAAVSGSFRFLPMVDAITGQTLNLRVSSKTGVPEGMAGDVNKALAGITAPNSPKAQLMADANGSVSATRRELFHILNHPDATGPKNLLDPQVRSLLGVPDPEAITQMTNRIIGSMRMTRQLQGGRPSDPDQAKVEAARGKMWNTPQDYITSMLTIYEIALQSKLEGQLSYPEIDLAPIFDELRRAFILYAQAGKIKDFVKKMPNEEEIMQRALKLKGVRPFKNQAGSWAGVER